MCPAMTYGYPFATFLLRFQMVKIFKIPTNFKRILAIFPYFIIVAAREGSAYTLVTPLVRRKCKNAKKNQTNKQTNKQTNPPKYQISEVSRGGGEHSHWKGVWGCAAVMTPFFQASRRFLAHQFTLNAPHLCPLFSIFRNFLHFQPCFGQNSSSLPQFFQNFRSQDPHFFRKIRSLDPTFLNPRGTHPQKKKKKKKKKLSAPPERIATERYQ